MTTRYQQAQGVACRSIDNESILVPVRRSTDAPLHIHTLNDVGSYIWNILQEPADFDAIVQAMMQEFEVAQPEAQKDALNFLSALQKLGLVVQQHPSAANEGHR